MTSGSFPIGGGATPPATIASALAASGNRPAGFDYMRLVLAIMVIFTHVPNLSFGEKFVHELWNGPWRPLLAIILPMFFALSGFLVAGSLERSRTLVSFFGLRLIRLVPALLVDTLIAALLIGPLLTTMPLAQYVRDPSFHAYFGNILGHIHFYLPGVFGDHPETMVNGQLWTLPWELACYVTLGLAVLVGIGRRPRLMLGAALALGLVNFAYEASLGLGGTPFQSDGTLLLAFLLGVALFLNRDLIRLSRDRFAISVILSTFFLSSTNLAMFAYIPVTYLTVYLGLKNPKRLRLIERGDYSYGIFLYGYPLQQVAIWMVGPQPWQVALAVALPMIFALAALSWHWVERPALRLRPHLLALEATLIARARIAFSKVRRLTA